MTFRLERDIPSSQPYDLVVVGGGPAGTAAAIQAARMGLKVKLVEGSGCLGGMGTSALVSNWSNLGNGETMIVRGVVKEWLEALQSSGNLPPHITPAHWSTDPIGIGFNAEALRRLLDDLCLQAGVELDFFTRLIDVDADPKEGKVRGVVLHNTEGYLYVPARCFIDATGDATLAHLSGAKTLRAGTDTPKIMPPTLCANVVGVDFARFNRHRDQQPAVEKAVKDGFFSQPDRHVPGLFRSGQHWGILNAGHLFDTDALDTRSLSNAMVKGRKLAEEYTEFLRQYLDGCEGAVNLGTAALLGVRESRRVIGEKMLDHGDYKARRHFSDQIGIYCKQVDIHVYDCSEAEYERYYNEFNDEDLLAPGESYGIPYGIIVPKGWKNLWAAGRCCCSDLKVNGAIRDQPACAIMGQAAGAAAALCISRGESASSLHTPTLISTLRDHGAYIPESN